MQSGIREGLKPSDIDTLLTQVTESEITHFTMEEKYMTEVDYPKIDEQLAAHIFSQNALKKFMVISNKAA